MDEIEANRIANEKWVARKVLTFEEMRERSRKFVKRRGNLDFYEYEPNNPVKRCYSACRG